MTHKNLFDIITVMKNKSSRSATIKKILEDPKLRGKHVVTVEGQIFSARTGGEAIKIFKDVVKKYPGKVPTVTYVPKAESLILIAWCQIFLSKKLLLLGRQGFMEKFATLFFRHNTIFFEQNA